MVFVALHGLSFIIRPFMKSQGIWLFLERGNDAQDNAWHLFNYIRRNHPEIPVKYALGRNSPDRKYLFDNQEHVITYGSLKYFLILFNAKYLISTHIQSYCYFSAVFGWIQSSHFDIHAKKIFLQHGCTHNYHPSFAFPRLKVHIFIAGAKNEENLLLTKFHYPTSIVKYTGLARFDNLHDFRAQRIILIMPTWRAKYAGYDINSFEKTDFFTEYKRLLTDSSLLKVLDEHGYEILFYNHMEFQKFNSSFASICSKRVSLVSFGEYRVQDLLKCAKLLITDYSSVYYDFFYMRKPIVFFKFNRQEFEKSQYGEDFDDPSEFGYVAESVSELIRMIDFNLREGCRFEERFIKKHAFVFPLFDRDNCKRIYKTIIDC